MRPRTAATLGSTAVVGVALAALFWPAAPPPDRSAGHPETDTSTLTIGTDVERSLADGERHVYRVGLKADHALHVVVHQRNVDVAVSVFDPQGHNLLAVDGPNGPDGPESLAVVATAEGEHRLEVAAAPDAAGGYQLQVETLGPAGELDRARAAGMKLYARAEQRRQEQQAVALRAALADYHQALEHFRQAEETLLEARTHWRIGKLLLARGDVDEALGNFEQALDLYRLCGNGWERAPLFNDAGEAYRLAGEPGRARELFERAIAVSRPLGNRLAVAIAFNNMGVLHASLGEMQRALAAYDKALEQWRQLGNQTMEAAVLHNLGVHYVSLGRLEEGFDFLHQAMAVRREMGDRRGQAVTLTAVGWTSGLQGDYEAALTAYDEALSLRRAVGDKQGEAVTLDQRGTVYHRMGRHEEALDCYRQALPLAEGNRLSGAHIRVNLGAVHMAMRQPEVAIDPLRRALQIFREMGALNGQAAALTAIARVERQLGRLTAARQHLEAALDIVESVRARLQSRWLRSSFLAVRHDDYGAYIDLLMQMEADEPDEGHATRAFEASERARARTLLESLAEARAGVRDAAAPELLESERALRAQINAKEGRRIAALAEGTTAEVAALDRELRSLLLEYEKLEGKIHATGARPLKESRPLSLEEIQREVLDNDTLLVAYSLGENRSFLWLVGRDSLVSYVLPARSEIEELARQVHKLLPRSHRPGVRRQASITIDELSKAVLGPAAGQLGEKRLLIVGDGALHYVPFAALPVPSFADGEVAVRPLLADHEIVHLPSASVLALLRRELAGRPPAPGLLAVVADPVFQLDDPRLSRTARGTGSDPVRGSDLQRLTRDFGGHFERLPFASVEAEAILALATGAESFRALGFEASRELVLSGELERYRIVHFATHGMLDAKHPALSGIVLSLVDETGKSCEGLLRVHEIFDLRLSADLVVLSACRTALGKEVRGEGLVGLTHGFFYAGAARLVVSFWNVNDRATAELMTRFYRGMLRDGLPPARALRSAQLSMLNEVEWQAPYYWAGFALQGDWR